MPSGAANWTGYPSQVDEGVAGFWVFEVESAVSTWKSFEAVIGREADERQREDSSSTIKSINCIFPLKLDGLNHTIFSKITKIADNKVQI